MITHSFTISTKNLRLHEVTVTAIKMKMVTFTYHIKHFYMYFNISFLVFKEKSPDNSVRKRKPSENKENDVDSSKSPESLRKGLLSQRRLRMLAHPMDSVKTDIG
jgi:hypothetical protein